MNTSRTQSQRRTKKPHVHTSTCTHERKKNIGPNLFKHKAHRNHHAHFYTPMFCDFCGRRGHIERFCYDKIGKTSYGKNRFTWKRDTNYIEPKAKWVPKLSSVSTGCTNQGGT